MSFKFKFTAHILQTEVDRMTRKYIPINKKPELITAFIIQTLPMSLPSSLLPGPSGLSLATPGQYFPLLLIERHKLTWCPHPTPLMLLFPLRLTPQRLLMGEKGEQCKTISQSRLNKTKT